MRGPLFRRLGVTGFFLAAITLAALDDVVRRAGGGEVRLQVAGIALSAAVLCGAIAYGVAASGLRDVLVSEGISETACGTGSPPLFWLN